jgi:hypothetical protein
MSASAQAVDLQADTLTAWEHYLQLARQRAGARIAPNGQFLWLDEEAGRAERLRKGEVAIAPIAGSGSEQVVHGLIHDWIGAIFVPNVSLDQVLDLLDDFGSYKTIYGPQVVDAQLLGRENGEEQYSVRFVNKVLFVTSGVDIRCKSRTVRLDERRAYSNSETVRVQEIKDYGKPSERELAPDTGDGFIWRLSNMARYEERDGGVYIETETIGLTRDIPGALTAFITPVVRRLSRNSVAGTLEKTRNALRPMAAGSNALTSKGLGAAEIHVNAVR